MIYRVAFAVCLLVGGIGFAVMAFVATRPAPPPTVIVAEAPVAPAPPPVRISVLVAQRALPAGTLLKDEDLAPRDMPPTEIPPGAMMNSPETRAELRGALLRTYLDANSTITPGDVLRPRDRGFLAAVLRPGFRAISVGVDAVTGTSGLIWPGDKVDLILTQELGGDNTPAGRRMVAETVLTDVRVIAVDQVFTQGATADAMPTGGRAVARTVTLETSPAQAERVAVGERLGRLSLVVRSMEHLASRDGGLSGPVFGSDVSPALSRSGLVPGARIRVIQGDESKEVTFR